MIIDGHAHVTKADYGSAARLIAEMDAHGIDRAVLVPGGMIDVRKMSRYVAGEEDVHRPTIPNDLLESLFTAQPDRFEGFYCIDPNASANAPEELARAVDRGFRGLKLAPLVHKFGLLDAPVLDLAAACAELQVPFYSHVTYTPASGTRAFASLVERFPRTTFILGHMGCGPADADAVDAAFRHDNLYLESSGGSFMIIKEALGRIGPSKMIYGSEFPMQHPRVELEKIRLCTDADSFVQVTSRTLLSLLDQRPRSRHGESPCTVTNVSA